MFSGLVEAKAAIIKVVPEPDGIRLVVERPESYEDIRLGDSIAIQGCCLTLVTVDEKSMSFQAGRETLSKTTLGGLVGGMLVNCERSLQLGDRIGGHLVSGHVDGLGTIVERLDQSDWSTITIESSRQLLSQMASKGSITVDGVSLTVVGVTDCQFSIALIPHTLQVTTLGELRIGSTVNLETDMLAKYVARQLEYLHRTGT